MQLSTVISLLFLTGFLTWKINWLPTPVKSVLDKRSLRCFWIVKMSVACLYLFIYTTLYTNRKEIDTFKFFDDSKVLAKATQSDPLLATFFFLGIDTPPKFQTQLQQKLSFWNRSYEDGIFNDNRLIIRINWLLQGVSFGNYGIHFVFFNLLSFIGLLYLLAALLELGFSKWPATIAALLIPSVLFWSSGVTKEPLTLITLGAHLFYFFEWIKGRKRPVTLILLTVLLIILKPYIFSCISPLLIAYFICEKQRKSLLTYGIIVLVFLCSTIAIHAFFPSYSPIVKLLNKQHEFVRFTNEVNFGSTFLFKQSYSLMELFVHSPIYLWYGFTKPLPFEATNLVQVAGMLENMFLLLLFIGAILLRLCYRINLKNIDVFCILFCVLLFTFLGVTTPNYGALLRYKTPALPFMLAFSIQTFFLFYQNKQLNHPTK